MNVEIPDSGRLLTWSRIPFTQSQFANCWVVLPPLTRRRTSGTLSLRRGLKRQRPRPLARPPLPKGRAFAEFTSGNSRFLAALGMTAKRAQDDITQGVFHRACYSERPPCLM